MLTSNREDQPSRAAKKTVSKGTKSTAVTYLFPVSKKREDIKPVNDKDKKQNVTKAESSIQRNNPSVNKSFVPDAALTNSIKKDKGSVKTIFNHQTRQTESPCKLIAKEVTERSKAQEEVVLAGFNGITVAEKSRNKPRSGFNKPVQQILELGEKTQNSKSLNNHKSPNFTKIASNSVSTKSKLKGNFSIQNTALASKLKQTKAKVDEKETISKKPVIKKKIFGLAKLASSILTKNIEKKEKDLSELKKTKVSKGKEEAKVTKKKI